MKNRKSIVGLTEFNYPNLHDIKDQSFFADMHFHSNLDKGGLTANYIIKALKEKSIAVAITDHNYIKGAVKLNNQNKKIVIPGVELIAKEGMHSIFYFSNAKELIQFYSKNIERKIDSRARTYLTLGLNEILDFSKKYNCVSCLPHPFAYFKPNFHKMLKSILRRGSIEAIETINGFIPHRFNINSARFSCGIKAGVSGGSDGRTLQELGGVLTYAKASTIEEFLEALRKRRTKVIGKETSLLNKARNIFHRPEMKPKYWPAYIVRRLKI